MEVFELYRLSLLPRHSGQIDLLEDLSREEYLRRAFGRKIEFSYFGDFHYVPLQNQPTGYIVGKIGKPKSVKESLPPEQGLEDTIHQGWVSAIIVIDPKTHQDGQKVSVELNRSVSKPDTLLFGLVKAINDGNPKAPYVIEAGPITRVEEFWNFAEQNRGSITSVTFDFITPNMLGTSDNLDQELRDIRDSEQGERVTLGIKGESIKTDTPRIKRSVEYAKATGSRIRARAKTKGGRQKSFDSKSKKVSVVLKDTEPQKMEEPLLAKVLNRISEVLGHE